MSFIAKHIVGSDERLMYIGRLHWIYMVKGCIWLAFFIAFSAWAAWEMLPYSDPSHAPQLAFIPGWVRSWEWAFPSLLLLGSGVMVFIIYLLRMMSTEIALTSERVIYKTGLLFVAVEEAVLSEINAESVNHGLLGRLLDYGGIKLDMRFVGDINLPSIRQPYRFLRAVHKAREQAGGGVQSKLLP